jgi:hypothetical protein
MGSRLKSLEKKLTNYYIFLEKHFNFGFQQNSALSPVSFLVFMNGD